MADCREWELEVANSRHFEERLLYLNDDLLRFFFLYFLSCFDPWTIDADVG
jgi:hypothetical protein